MNNIGESKCLVFSTHNFNKTCLVPLVYKRYHVNKKMHGGIQDAHGFLQHWQISHYSRWAARPEAGRQGFLFSTSAQVGSCCGKGDARPDSRPRLSVVRLFGDPCLIGSKLASRGRLTACTSFGVGQRPPPKGWGRAGGWLMELSFKAKNSAMQSIAIDRGTLCGA